MVGNKLTVEGDQLIKMMSKSYLQSKVSGKQFFFFIYPARLLNSSLNSLRNYEVMRGINDDDDTYEGVHIWLTLRKPEPLVYL